LPNRTAPFTRVTRALDVLPGMTGVPLIGTPAGAVAGATAPNGNVLVDRGTGRVRIALTNTGAVAVCFAVYPNQVPPPGATPTEHLTEPAAEHPAATASVLVGPHAAGHLDWATSAGRYDLCVSGPDGFLRSFAGTVVPAAQHTDAVPAVRAELNGYGVRLELANGGRRSVRFTVAAGDSPDRTRTRQVAGGDRVYVDWPARDGWYDVIVTAPAQTPLAYRFAGRVQQP
jgi:phospholipase C